MWICFCFVFLDVFLWVSSLCIQAPPISLRIARVDWLVSAAGAAEWDDCWFSFWVPEDRPAVLTKAPNHNISVVFLLSPNFPTDPLPSLSPPFVIGLVCLVCCKTRLGYFFPCGFEKSLESGLGSSPLRLPNRLKCDASIVLSSDLGVTSRRQSFWFLHGMSCNDNCPFEWHLVTVGRVRWEMSYSSQ